MSVKTNKRTTKWVAGVVGLYGGFVLLIFVLVMVAARQDFQLVESDYYQKGLAHQERIEETARANSLGDQISVSYSSDDSSIVVHFPPVVNRDDLSGIITLYRPSNSHWDREIKIAVDSFYTQRIPADELIPGFWRIKVQWQVDGEKFFGESSFIL